MTIRQLWLEIFWIIGCRNQMYNFFGKLLNTKIFIFIDRESLLFIDISWSCLRTLNYLLSTINIDHFAFQKRIDLVCNHLVVGTVDIFPTLFLEGLLC